MNSRKNVAHAVCRAAFCAVLVTGTSMQAATITSTSVAVGATDAGGHGSLPLTTSFSLPEFNTALGTLTGVEVDLHLTYQGEVDVFNFTGALNSFTNGTSSVPIDLTTPSVANSLLATASYSVASGNANPPMFTATFFPGPTTVGTLAYNPLPADFASYEGLGNNSYTLSYGAGSYFVTGIGVGAGGDANSSGSASVTYTYTPTPEPSSLVLLGLGVLALVGIAVRRMRIAP